MTCAVPQWLPDCLGHRSSLPSVLSVCRSAHRKITHQPSSPFGFWDRRILKHGPLLEALGAGHMGAHPKARSWSRKVDRPGCLDCVIGDGRFGRGIAPSARPPVTPPVLPNSRTRTWHQRLSCSSLCFFSWLRPRGDCMASTGCGYFRRAAFVHQKD